QSRRASHARAAFISAKPVYSQCTSRRRLGRSLIGLLLVRRRQTPAKARPRVANSDHRRPRRREDHALASSAGSWLHDRRRYRPHHHSRSPQARTESTAGSICVPQEVLRIDMENFVHHAANPGPVFFERGVLDALCGLDHIRPLNESELSMWLSKYQYFPKVFVLPPWKAIYEKDA